MTARMMCLRHGHDWKYSDPRIYNTSISGCISSQEEIHDGRRNCGRCLLEHERQYFKRYGGRIGVLSKWK